jgi:polyisoprenoid-binding protein YceI
MALLPSSNYWCIKQKFKLMKLLKAVWIVVAIGILASFTSRDREYKIDNEKSRITWVGKKVTGQHAGTINLMEGKLTSNGNMITGGVFTIDMTSLKDEDGNQRLEAHLKSDDFFSTANYPTATFITTQIESKGGDQYVVKGKLTIKGITNEMEFPAIIQMAHGQVSAKAKIVVDRTKFDIKFRSGNFFENLGDKMIDDIFELNVDLVGSGNV